jgi:hypothetical protein
MANEHCGACDLIAPLLNKNAEGQPDCDSQIGSWWRASQNKTANTYVIEISF